MKIRGNEVDNVNELLKEALQKGYRYVSLDTGKEDEYFRPESMQYFSTKSEVQHHNYMRHTIDQQYREALPTLLLLEQLQRKMELQQHTQSPGSEPKDIVIDTGIIRHQERARTEVFTEEISRQLRERDIKPDVKQLQEHIGRDEHHFTIGGTRRENGSERSYTIHIEQNEHRAFFIQNIEPQQTIQQKSNTIMIELIDGSLRKEDAREIRDMMRTEIEKGNRFVSFPTDKTILTKEDFNVFKSAFDALQHAYDNTTDRDLYIVRSASVVEKEMSRLLETEKEQKQEKPRENEREAKPSRDQGMSR